MKPWKKRIGFVVFGIAAALWCLVFLPKKSTRTYKGQTVEAWISNLKKPGIADELFEGPEATNTALAFAILTAALDVKDTSIQKKWRSIWPELPAAVRRHFNRPTLIPDQTRCMALLAFGAKKQYYQPAVPKLLKIAVEDEHAQCRFLAVMAIESVVGNDDHPPDPSEIDQAVKVLNEACKDPDRHVKTEAAKALNLVDPGKAVARMKANQQGK